MCADAEYDGQHRNGLAGACAGHARRQGEGAQQQSTALQAVFARIAKVVPFAHAGAGISVEAAAALHARQPCASDRPAQEAIRAMGPPWQSVRQA